MVNIKSDKGTISITSEVLTYLAGVAATSCFGVKGMIGRSKDGGACALELHIGVDRGGNLSAVAKSIVNEVSYKLSKSAGVPVRRVDVYIDSIIG